MRHECEVYVGLDCPEKCGQPAVDYVEALDGDKLWMCAEHFDANRTEQTHLRANDKARQLHGQE